MNSLRTNVDTFDLLRFILLLFDILILYLSILVDEGKLHDI